MSLRRHAVGPLILGLLLLLPLAEAAAALYVADGLGGDWGPEDEIGRSVSPPSDGNATLDLLALSQGDNASAWFFQLSFLWTPSPGNATLVLYLFGPDDASPARDDPSGNAVHLPGGAPLDYVLTVELSPVFPAGSRVAFFDGALWKNRTFGELGVTAARNDSAAFVELGLPRDAFSFLSAGSAAAALVVAGGSSPQKHLADSVPDLPASAAGALPGRVRFFDYTFRPPVVFSALGLSDPFAAVGDHAMIFVELTNEGPKNVSGVSAQALIDGNVLAAREGLTLLSHNGTAVLSFDWLVSAGRHNVTARSFPGGAERSLTLLVPEALPLLTIEGAAVTPQNPQVGQAFAVSVVVRNDGAGPSPAREVLLKDGTQVLATASLASIPPGGSGRVSLESRIGRAGAIALRVEIDGMNSANATRLVELGVTAPQPPFGIPALAWLVVGAGACAAGAWLLTPRLVGRGKRPLP